MSEPGSGIHVATGWGSGWDLRRGARHSLGLPAPGGPVLPGPLRAFCASCIKEQPYMKTPASYWLRACAQASCRLGFISWVCLRLAG